MSAASLRLFAGVYPPRAVCDQISDELMRGALPEGRWVDAAQMHLTLAFLGDRACTELGAIETALDRACAAAPPFQVRLHGIDGFPTARRARVLVLKVAEGAAELARLHRDFVAALDPASRPSDQRPFRPHLTLARLHEPPSAAAWTALEQRMQPRAWDFGLGEACLVQSHLGPSGAQHQQLRRARFGG